MHMHDCHGFLPMEAILIVCGAMFIVGGAPHESNYALSVYVGDILSFVTSIPTQNNSRLPVTTTVKSFSHTKVLTGFIAGAF